MRVGIRTIVSLALCAAALGAALSHIAIDIVGDYALARDSYDDLRHGSRDLVTAIALLVAAFVAARGLRICCDIAANNRTRLLRPVLRAREIIGMQFAAVAGSIAIVPAMEYLDGRLDGMPVHRLGDAFGGSILLGLVTTIACAALVALCVYVIAYWLISHRDSIATFIGAFLRSLREESSPNGFERVGRLFTLRRRRPLVALGLGKRAPPETGFA